CLAARTHRILKAYRTKNRRSAEDNGLRRFCESILTRPVKSWLQTSDRRSSSLLFFEDNAVFIQVAKSILLVVSALFPIVDPIGGAPVFLSLTIDYTPQARRLLARRIAINSFILLIASFTIGTYVLSFFGISLPVVQVGGGMIVIATGWSMLKQRNTN